MQVVVILVFVLTFARAGFLRPYISSASTAAPRTSPKGVPYCCCRIYSLSGVRLDENKIATRGVSCCAQRELEDSQQEGEPPTPHQKGLSARAKELWRTIAASFSVFLRNLLRGISMPTPLLPPLAPRINRFQDEKKSDTFSDNKRKPRPASLGFSIRESVIAIISYLALGVLSYSFLFERWSIADSLYFCVTTFTIVGYGDLNPTTRGGRLFTCLFALGGVAFLGVALATIGSNLVEAEVAALQAATKASQRRMLDVFKAMPHVLKRRKERNGKSTVGAKVAEKEPPRVTDEPVGALAPSSRSWRTTLKRIVLKYIAIYSFLFLAGVLIGRLESWSVVDSIYYSVITSGTVGYGDFSPVTRAGRLCSILFIPLSVAAAGDVLGSIASSILERRRDMYFHDLVEKDLTVDDLKAMDADANGEVSRIEYIEFMLVRMNVVESDVLKELNAQFDRLDLTKSNTLVKRDLELLAELKNVEKWKVQ